MLFLVDGISIEVGVLRQDISAMRLWIQAHWAGVNTGCSSIEANPDEVEIDTNDVDVPKELAITEDAKHNLQFLRFVQNNWSEHAYSTGMSHA